MKLEPGRTSLSGRPGFLDERPRSAVTSTPLAVARKCSSCGVDDVAQEVFDGDARSHFEHLVTIELRYIDKPELVTTYLASKGWKYRFHQARHAMERFICRPCLIAHREMATEFSRKKSNELKASLQQSNYYLAVCGDQ